ncbi:OmpH family outer membrane protein [Ascidiimonas aurantiaca]|uniref:OmpH family outer membrane protein n=1 Tax=Ascidiimonas aurantiaca TaxID=1685432 RepID=UPI0030EDCF09
MQKLSFPLALLAFAASIFSFFWFQSATELVYVDVNKLLEGYKRTKVERDAFNAKAALMKANTDSLMTGWQKELQAYEKEQASYTEKERALKQELLANKQQQINNYQQAMQRQLREEDQKMTQTVINDINDYVKEYGKEKGYKIIFGAGGNGSIMYADDATDLTEEVLDGLNKQYKGV